MLHSQFVPAFRMQEVWKTRLGAHHQRIYNKITPYYHHSTRKKDANTIMLILCCNLPSSLTHPSFDIVGLAALCKATDLTPSEERGTNLASRQINDLL
jgi:hypothetical protein